MNHGDDRPGATDGPAQRIADGITRRVLLRRGASIGAALSFPAALGLDTIWPQAASAATRRPGSLPNPAGKPGTVNTKMPFDHIVVVMMENHSFDNLLGALALHGTPAADGLTFDPAGNSTNSNPGAANRTGPVAAFPFLSTAQGSAVTQSWNAVHQQIDAGRMDGFVSSAASAGGPAATQPMGYYPPSVLPFAYSLASSFTVANRWFSSMPGPTYPNRRFLMAGTAYGGTATELAALKDPPPPRGTIFDLLHTYGISWRNYFTDVPQMAMIPSALRKHWTNARPVGAFHLACRSGRLPAVSFVDPEFGVGSDVGGELLKASLPLLKKIGAALKTRGGDEEDPQDMYYGEHWAYGILEAVLRSPAWPRTLLIYTYDEHGGYYDHVPPPPAIRPDSIRPKLRAKDLPGDYNIYGPRVPAVVVSPHSRPGGVTNVVHDHTSVLATIEAKWNLPALSYRDANAATVMDFLDLSKPRLLRPPKLIGPSATGPSGPVQ